MNRPVRTAVLLVSAVSCLVLGSATPGSAAGAQNTAYPGTWTFSGGVTAQLTARTSYVSLRDYRVTDYYDRVTASPGRRETVKVGQAVCPAGTYYDSGVSLYAEPVNWSNMPTGSLRQGRLRIACVIDGATHHFRWGSGSSPTNCIVVTRPEPTVYRLSADAGCPAEDAVVDNAGNTIRSTAASLPFDATLLLAGPSSPPPTG